jgi:hypothetical protein
MTTEEQDSATEQTEAGGQPTPQFSDASQGKDSKTTADAGLAKEVSELKAQLRSMQSGKDKAIDRVSRNIEDLKKYLPADIHDKIDKAEREAKIDALLRGDDAPLSTPPVPGRTVKDEYLDRAAKILKDLSPDEQKEVLSQVATQEFGSVDDAIIAVGDAKVNVKLNSAKKNQPASPAGAIAPTGKTHNENPDNDYRKEVELINQGKHPTIRRGQTRALLDLQRKYREKGVQI